MLQTIIRGYFTVLKITVAACLAGMVCMVFTNVVLRYFFNSGLTVSEEFSRWLFVYITFLGAVLLLKDRRHLMVDILVANVPRKTRTILDLLTILVMIGITVLIAMGSMTQVRVAGNSFAPATGFSMAYLYAAGLIFSFTALPILLYEIYLTATGREPFPGYRDMRPSVE